LCTPRRSRPHFRPPSTRAPERCNGHFRQPGSDEAPVRAGQRSAQYRGRTWPMAPPREVEHGVRCCAGGMHRAPGRCLRPPVGGTCARRPQSGRARPAYWQLSVAGICETQRHTCLQGSLDQVEVACVLAISYHGFPAAESACSLWIRPLAPLFLILPLPSSQQ
jgi:hypothetical protein